MKRQAFGWLMAGVVAAGLNASYHDGGMAWAHRAFDRVEQATTVARDVVSGKTDLFLAEARVFLNRDASSEPMVAVEQAPLRLAQLRVIQPEAAIARVQVMSACQQHALARMEVKRARMEAQQARMEARLEERMAHFRMPAVVVNPATFKTLYACPRVRVNVPQLPAINVPAMPVIRLAVSAGPV